MELISMTDFVLQEEKKGMQNTDRHLRFEKILKYAKFLKQPLKLEMFIPCDKDGNVLEEPQMRPERNSFDEEDMDYDAQELYDYIKAKEKVLFEGFEVKGNYIMYYDFAYMMKYELEGKTVENIIDEIPNNSLQLTQNATKQFL